MCDKSEFSRITQKKKKRHVFQALPLWHCPSKKKRKKKREEVLCGNRRKGFRVLIRSTTMLSRLLPKPSHLRALTTLVSFKPQPQPQSAPRTTPSFGPAAARFRFFSSNGGDDDLSEKGAWNPSQESGGDFDSLFGGGEDQKPWTLVDDDDNKGDLFDFGDLASDIEAEVKETDTEDADVAERREKEEQALLEMLKGFYFLSSFFCSFLIVDS